MPAKTTAPNIGASPLLRVRCQYNFLGLSFLFREIKADSTAASALSPFPYSKTASPAN